LILFNRDCLYEVTILEVPFDYARCERLLQRAERINACVKSSDGRLPAQIDRPDICRNCPFLIICSPKLEAHPDDAPIVLGPETDGYGELHGLLASYVTLDTQRREAESVKKTLRDRLIPGQRLIIGDYVVDWKIHGKGWRMTVKDSSRGAEGDDDDSPKGKDA